MRIRFRVTAARWARHGERDGVTPPAPLPPAPLSTAPLETALAVIVLVAAVVVLVAGVTIIVRMDGGPGDQGGRLMVATGTLFVLGALDGQLDRLERRRATGWEAWGASSPAVRRSALRRLLVLLLAGALLFGLALWLP